MKASGSRFTPKQGRYLTFIHSYTSVHRRPPAEADIQVYFRVTAPAVHSMILTLEKRGLISREPGQARSIRVLVPTDDLPALDGSTTDSPKTRTSRGKKVAVLEKLKPEEAGEVLRRLIATHPELGGEVERIADSVLRDVSFEDVANEVEDAVGAVDMDDLHGRAGRHEWGYVGPEDAAQELLDEAVAPFLENMKRMIEMKLDTEALEVCKGIALGLYRTREQKAGNSVLEYASDFPVEAAGWAIKIWSKGGEEAAVRDKKRSDDRAFPPDFVERHMPKWRK